MNVKFYYNNYPPNKVDKNTDKDNPILQVYNVRFKEDNTLNIVNPIIIFAPTDGSPNASLDDWKDIVECAKFNYFYIPKFERFYFIQNMKTSGGLIEITGKCDVLNSFKNDILNSEQFILRQQNKRSKYLSDSHIPVRSDHKYYMKTFGDNVDDKTCSRMILITTGKGGTVVS